MPQIPSPNMQIIWPTDNDDANVWAPIMDTAVRVVIDGHDHSTGNGAKVKISQLSFDADISFIDSLGGKHAITDLKAIDFFPSPASAMTGFSGAFFVSDGTGGLVLNELYYRSIGGTNIQVTTGGTLNVAAFSGGIGGDYGSVSALLSYLDAGNAYQLFQQIGASVRQFAKLQSADLSLFEFKAHGVAGVPTQAVTLKSPAALALGYVLTLPGTLPSTPAVLTVDSAGTITTGFPNAITHNVAFANLGTASGSGASIANGGNSVGGVGTNIVLSTSTQSICLPLHVPTGVLITEWGVRIQKTSAAGTISCRLWEDSDSSQIGTQIGTTQSNGANNPGFITIGQTGLTQAVTGTRSYFIELNGGGTNGDFVWSYWVKVA